MKKAIFLALIGLIIVVGLLAGVKALQIKKMIAQSAGFQLPPEVVTSSEVKAESWKSYVTAVGSLDAVQGVVVTGEVTGKVVDIAFEPGSQVAAGDLLVQQDISSEEAQLRSAKSVSALALIEYKRTKGLLAKNVISQSSYDNARAQLTQSQAQADNIKAVIAKKSIRAPFAGRLGIRQVNLGQVINEGQPIVTLQSLDPIYVNFSIPQQKLAQISAGLDVQVTSDARPDHVMTSKITTINPEVDAATRNIHVQATLANPSELLRPGMYANVAVILPEEKEVLVIPATAVLYAPYSDSVFVIEKSTNENGTPGEGQVVRQQFVRLGEKRGDYITIESGLEAGDMIVSTGVFKLRNKQAVVVDNKLAPDFQLAPQPAEN